MFSVLSASFSENSGALYDRGTLFRERDAGENSRVLVVLFFLFVSEKGEVLGFFGVRVALRFSESWLSVGGKLGLLPWSVVFIFVL